LAFAKFQFQRLHRYLFARADALANAPWWRLAGAVVVA
jgi:hypothetical protein